MTQVAAQLYTLRDWMKTPKEIAASLARVREIGYRSVQVSGLGPIETAELKKILLNEGLICAATHEDAGKLIEDPSEIAAKLHELDCTLTAYPYPHGISFAGLTEVKEFASKLNRSGRLLQEQGISLSYHNHNIEFMRIGGRPILEIIYDETDPQFLQAELDTYWIQIGGGNPVDWCERMRGRMPMLHLKDLGVNDEHVAVYREIGQGNLNWPAIIGAAEASGCRWFIVEQDGNWIDDDPFKSLKMSFEYISEHLVD